MEQQGSVPAEDEEGQVMGQPCCKNQLKANLEGAAGGSLGSREDVPSRTWLLE